ncbi:hypothetical protein ACX0FC_17520, partial [Enterococcus faecium]
MIAAFAVVLSAALLFKYGAAAPPASRLGYYYDEPSKLGIIFAMAWLILGLFVGDWVAWLLVNPELTFDVGWSSFGRL